MQSVQLVFCEELAPLVKKSSVMHEVRFHVTRRASVKDVIESYGVPHTEVFGFVSQRDDSFSALCFPGGTYSHVAAMLYRFNKYEILNDQDSVVMR